MEIYLWFLIFIIIFRFFKDIAREKEKVLVLIRKYLIGIAAAFISCWLFVLLIRILLAFYNITPAEVDTFLIYFQDYENIVLVRFFIIGTYLFVATMQKYISKFLSWLIVRIKQKIKKNENCD